MPVQYFREYLDFPLPLPLKHLLTNLCDLIIQSKSPPSELPLNYSPLWADWSNGCAVCNPGMFRFSDDDVASSFKFLQKLRWLLLLKFLRRSRCQSCMLFSFPRQLQPCSTVLDQSSLTSNILQVAVGFLRPLSSSASWFNGQTCEGTSGPGDCPSST
jgi:hypothetical protein